MSVSHPWCLDPSRDEAVRAAEDGRSGPLPTLDECIERVWPVVWYTPPSGVADAVAHAMHASMALGCEYGFRKVDDAWAMIPKTGSATSGPEQENKGNDMATKAQIQQAAYLAEASEQQAPATTVLRTAEMTLEVVYDPGWLDSFESIGDKVLRLVRRGLGKAAGESVRLVDLPLPFAAVIVERNDARIERDAAIREREELRESYRHCRAANNLVCDERDTLRARVAELESAAKLAPAATADGKSNHAPPAASGAAVCENAHGSSTEEREMSGEIRRVVPFSGGDPGSTPGHASRQPASGAAGTEAMAYFVKWDEKDWGVQDQTFRTLERAQDYINDEKLEGDNPQTVPLYAAPQPAKGWLTAEEREALERAFDLLCDDDGDNPLAGTVQKLLARSSPPEVVLPGDCGGESYDSFVAGWNNYRDEALKALAAAGVTVKEVGRE